MADDRIYLQSQPWIPLHPVSAAQQRQKLTANGAAFADFLQRQTESVKFSQHAIERMQSRNLEFSQQDLSKLNAAVDRIAQKGARESLVYLNDVALVVSVQNKTVITAMDGGSAKENIFMNIDSAVIL